MTAAALGTTIAARDARRPEHVDIRPGTQSGQSITLHGPGRHAPARQGRGDLIVHVDVQTPTRLDAEQEELLRELATLRGEDGPDVGQFDRPAAGFLLPAAGRVQRALSDGRLSAMSAPVFVVAAERLVVGRVVVDGAEGRHAATVTRLAPGEAVVLTDAHGRRASGVVAGADRDVLAVDVTSVVDVPAPQPRFVVVQALPKGDRGELAVETMTEVGVDVVVPWAAARCVTRWRDARGQKALTRWRTSGHSAAKQSRRAWFPEIAGWRRRPRWPSCCPLRPRGGAARVGDGTAGHCGAALRR